MARDLHLHRAKCRIPDFREVHADLHLEHILTTSACRLPARTNRSTSLANTVLLLVGSTTGDNRCVAMLIILHATSLFKPIASAFLLRLLIQARVRIQVVFAILTPWFVRYVEQRVVTMWITY